MRKRVLLCAGLIVAVVGVASRSPGQEDLDPETAEAFAWFDRLEYPTLADRKLVRVTTGWWRQSGDDPPQNRDLLAFLTEEEDRKFTVLRLNLTEVTFEKTPPGTPDHERVDFEILDMKTAGRELLEALQGADPDDHWRRHGEILSERGELFLLARACELADHTRLANDLVSHAKTLDGRDRSGPSKTTGQLREAVAKDFAHAEMWRTFLQFGNPRVGRPELLKRLRKFIARFPESAHIERARETADLLGTMVEEDEARGGAANRTPPENMTPEERVADLIFQLRDQNGAQWSQPGACDIFQDPREEESPAHQLVELGFDAVPQLIEVIDDRRFTRSVGYHRNFYFSHYVLRVGDCAQTILAQIAGRSFYDRKSTSGAMVKDGQAGETKKQVREWWAGIQGKGLKQVLIEGTEAGDANSPHQAHQLIEKFPDAAVDAIARGASNAERPWTRTYLVETAAKLEGDRATAFLRQEMRSAPSLPTRVAAAEALAGRPLPEAIPAMIAEWEKLDEKKWDQTKDADARDYEKGGVTRLVSFLAGAGRPDAVETLAKNFENRGLATRMAIVSAFGQAGNFSAIGIGSGGNLNPGGAGKSLPPETRKATEDLLIAALKDLQVREGYSGTWNGKSFSDPRICDIAGYVLNERWPDKYGFDLSASLFRRDRQRIAALNIWREENGLSPLPPPERKLIPRLPDETTLPKFQAIIETKDPSTRGLEIEAYERLGLGALPALNEHLAKLPETHGAVSDLKSLAARLACIVEEIEFADRDSAPPDEALKKRLDKLREKPLTSAAFLDVLLETAKDLPDGAEGIALNASRHGDGSGIQITATLPTERVLQAGIQKGWDSSIRVKAGKRNLLSSGGILSREYGVTPEAHSDLVTALDEAFSAPPSEPLKARVRLVLEK